MDRLHTKVVPTVITDCTIAELERLGGRYYWLALRIAKDAR